MPAESRFPPSHWTGRLFCVCLLPALLAGAAAGCAPARFSRLCPEIDRSQPSMVFFLVDGMDHARLYRMLEAGELPNIQKRFVEGGVQVRHAFTSLPSITYPNCHSLITGVFPGHHGIMGNYWFDRYTLYARYYMTLDTYRTVNQHSSVPTLYDALHDQFTLNIQNHTRRGVTHTIDNKAMFAVSWALRRYSEADLYVGGSVDEAIDIANRVCQWPRVLMTYYPGVDDTGHLYGTDSAKYAGALKDIDTVVGRVTCELDSMGLGNSLYYCLLTDHGHPAVDPDKHIDMLEWLKKNRCLKIWSKPILDESYARRFSKLRGYDAVARVDATRSCLVHLRGPDGTWRQRPDEATLVEWINREPSLLSLPAVEMVSIRAGADRARLLSRDGTAVVERRLHDGAKQYRVIERTGDVLHSARQLQFASFVDAGWHGSREWLGASAETDYPDLVPQIVEMFDSSHTPDVEIMAAEGWGFAFGPAENGGHGSCLAADMHIPMMFAGPDLPQKATIEYARMVDVMPTVLGLIGEADRLKDLPPIDGIDLSAQLRSAK